VADRELFQHLQINIKGMWEQLLWLDSANWGGIRYRDPEEEAAAGAADQTGEEEYGGAGRGGGLDTLREDDELRDSDDDGDSDDAVEEGMERGVFGSGLEGVGSGEYDFLDDINEEVALATQQEEEEWAGAGRRGRRRTESATGYVDGDGDADLEGHELPDGAPRAVSVVEGSWDLVTLLPPAAGLYLRSAIGEKYAESRNNLCPHYSCDAVRSIHAGVSRAVVVGSGELPRDQWQPGQCSGLICVVPLYPLSNSDDCRARPR
jgi:hypothetical protein